MKSEKIYANFEEFVKEQFPTLPETQIYNFLEIVVTEAERSLAIVGVLEYGDKAAAIFGSAGWKEKNDKEREALFEIFQAQGYGVDPEKHPDSIEIPKLLNQGIPDWKTFTLSVQNDATLNERVAKLKINYDKANHAKSPWLE